MTFYDFLKPALQCLPPEAAHKLTLSFLKTGLVPHQKMPVHYALKTSVAGITFDHPLGMAAGFDKNAETMPALLKAGFAAVEVGTVTPEPQSGNPKPRIFRDVKSGSVINRMGFPSKGSDIVRHNLALFRQHYPDAVIGVNIGMNRDTTNPAEDYSFLTAQFEKLANYLVINISSPNTAGLRDLQYGQKLDQLLAQVQTVPRRCPLFLKIAPDLTLEQKETIADYVLQRGIDGLVISNTTLTRPKDLPERYRQQAGGLSGLPLQFLSTRVIADMYRLTEGRVPIIGAGGIACAQSAYEKIRAGASVLQLYTALVYQGYGVLPVILDELASLLHRDGFSHISDAVGVAADDIYEAGHRSAQAIG